MSAVDSVIEKVRLLDEATARALLPLIETLTPSKPLSPVDWPSESMAGFARQFCPDGPRTTAEWMKILREGDEDDAF